MDYKTEITESVTELKKSIDARRAAGMPVDQPYIATLLATPVGKKLARAVMDMEDHLPRKWLRNRPPAATAMIAGKDTFTRISDLLMREDMDPGRAYQWFTTAINHSAIDAVRRAKHHVLIDPETILRSELDRTRNRHFMPYGAIKDEIVVDEQVLEKILIRTAQQLDSRQRQTMKVWLGELDEGEKGMQRKVAQKLAIPLGTAKSRLADLHKNVLSTANAMLSQHGNVLTEKECRQRLEELFAAEKWSFDTGPVIKAIDQMDRNAGASRGA